MAEATIPDEVRDEIARMWQEGISAALIGARLKRSRNSVIGVIDRLRKSGANLIHPSVPREKKHKSIAALFSSSNLPEDGVPMEYLRLSMCRFIIGEARGIETRYCGKKREENCSYCKEHKLICYKPAPKLKPVKSYR